MKTFEAQTRPMHCIFRRGTAWFALPAVAVREVLMRPAIAVAPQSDPVLAGLCHVRGEFLPVLRLDALLVDGGGSPSPERKMIVVNRPEGFWAVLADEVAGLAVLETSAAPDAYFDDAWSDALAGWSTYQSQVVRVLDPNRFYRAAQQALERCWKTWPPASEPTADGNEEDPKAADRADLSDSCTEEPSEKDSVCPDPVSG